MKFRTVLVGVAGLAAGVMHANANETKANTQENGPATAAAIRPFHVAVPQQALADRRQLIAMTRWSDRETGGDRSQGAQLAKSQALVRYWGTAYDWRKA